MRLKLLALTSISLVALSFTACGGDNKSEEKITTRTEVPAPIEESSAEKQSRETKSITTEESAVKSEEKAPATQTTASAPVDGKQIFGKCQSCHGQSAEMSALGKSQVIKGWSADKIVDALHGYKAGTYGGEMKGLMKGQVAPLNDAQIEAVAEHISKL